MSRKYALVLTMASMAATASLVLAAAGGGGGGGRGATPAPQEAPITLPKSTPADGKPQINGPRVASGNTGHIFLYKLPASGEGELTYSADNLPPGLTLNAKTGVITGTLKAPVTTAVNFHVKSAKGEATKQIVLVVGDHKLSLTPPLGWNSWNCWGTTVSDARVRAAADGFFNSGLVNHGFQYVNIDDGWEIRGSGADTRAADGTILVNNKFPDMKALGDYIHSKGLKFGIYSGPGPTTCGGYAASWQHELQDTTTWASWGVDYIKYDWCSYDSVIGGRPQMTDLPALKKPYQLLRTVIDKQDRDMVMSLCQYGWGDVWKWGAEDGINGNLWRATIDITDTWQSMSTIGFAQNGHEQYAGPGHWNDTDMLVVGKVGWNNTPRANRMTQNEQITHITLWSILAAPLLLGNDLTQMDDFTINLMSNDEMLAVNQDAAGKQGWRIAALDANDQPVSATPPAPATAIAPATTTVPGTTTTPGARGGRGGGRGGRGNPQNTAVKQIWARPLLDGTYAVGLFNLGEEPTKVSISLKDLGTGLKATNLAGAAQVRDIWQLKDLGVMSDTISATVPRHGSVFLRVGTPKSDAECVADIVKMHPPK